MRFDQCIMRFAKLSENAYAPVKGSAKAAGFDLRSAYDYIVPARGKEIVKTDLQIQVPEGSYGRVAPRSGLAAKNFIDVGAGVIDEDYRGNLGVVLFNHSETAFEVKKGDRIAQLICERIFYPDLQEEKSLSETERGADGFGSTGVKGDLNATNGDKTVAKEKEANANAEDDDMKENVKQQEVDLKTDKESELKSDKAEESAAVPVPTLAEPQAQA